MLLAFLESRNKKIDYKKLFKYYEATLCILCIVSGFRNRPQPDLLGNP